MKVTVATRPKPVRGGRRRLFAATAALILLCAACGAEQAAPARSEAPLNVGAWQQAKARGVAFRATGQEPAWLLEISADAGIVLMLDYGATRRVTPWREPVTGQEAGQTIYRSGDIEIRVDDRECRDTMSGEVFAATVSVSIPGRSLRGCGRPLE
jgi:uncharacterized membrane protein